METMFYVRVKVPSRLLTPVVELFAKEGLQVSVTPCTQPSEAAPPTPAKGNGASIVQRRYRNGKRVKGVKGGDLVLAVIKKNGGRATETVLASEFDSYGFADTSLPTYLSRLANEGVIAFSPQTNTWSKK